MANFLVLTVGELTRMKKYQILPATVFIAILWMGLLYLVDGPFITQLFTILIFVDATTMAILLVGVTMFFEKQEGTFRSLLVSPIHKSEYILSKGISNVVSNFITLFLLFAFAYWVKDVSVNLLGFLGAVALVGFFHTMLGFLLSYYAKDFTSLLMRMMVYAFVFVIPIILEQVGLIQNEMVSNLLYLIPTKASMTVLNSAVSMSGVETWQIVVSIMYLIIGSGVLFLLVMRQFDAFAQKEGGA